MKVKGAEKAIRAAMNKRITEFKRSKDEGERSAKIIQNELRKTLREGVLPSGDNFPSLKQKTIERRRQLAKANKTSKYYKDSLSNATLTGDLVRKIFVKFVGGKMEIFGKGKHIKYKGVRGKNIKGSDSSIADIIESFASRGANLLGVPDSAKIRIKKQFLRFWRRKRG